jgi:hypothetical protein
MPMLISRVATYGSPSHNGKTYTRDEQVEEWAFKEDSEEYEHETGRTVGLYVALRDRSGHPGHDYIKGSAEYKARGSGRTPALLDMNAERGHLIVATRSWYEDFLARNAA